MKNDINIYAVTKKIYTRNRTRLKLLKNKLHIKLLAHTKWMKLVNKSQTMILSAAPHVKYRQRYKDEELFYWLRIPKWIYQISKKRVFLNCLDIGVAYGTLALFCKTNLKCETYCTDYTAKYISPHLLNKYNIYFAVSNIELDEFPWKKKYDIILFTEVLEHLNFHPVATLQKIRNMLSDDGILYISTPDASKWGRVTKYYAQISDIPNPSSGKPVIDDHIYQYSVEEFINIVNDAGFKIQKLKFAPGLINRHINAELVRK
jgi:2-polyprenyl-3-methyl-5-hydroxy-6-metoxy-1,4-benzoquinol methylase